MKKLFWFVLVVTLGLAACQTAGSIGGVQPLVVKPRPPAPVQTWAGLSKEECVGVQFPTGNPPSAFLHFGGSSTAQQWHYYNIQGCQFRCPLDMACLKGDYGDDHEVCVQYDQCELYTPEQQEAEKEGSRR